MYLSNFLIPGEHKTEAKSMENLTFAKVVYSHTDSKISEKIKQNTA